MLTTSLNTPPDINLEELEDKFAPMQDKAEAELQRLCAGMNPTETATFALSMMLMAGLKAKDSVGKDFTLHILQRLESVLESSREAGKTAQNTGMKH